VVERARHSGVDEGVGAKKGNNGGRRGLWWPGGPTERKKGRGSRGSAPRGGENGEKRRSPRSGGGQLGRPTSAPVGGRGRRRGHATGEGDGARATRV
jgi:hypothetical protein